MHYKHNTGLGEYYARTGKVQLKIKGVKLHEDELFGRKIREVGMKTDTGYKDMTVEDCINAIKFYNRASDHLRSLDSPSRTDDDCMEDLKKICKLLSLNNLEPNHLVGLDRLILKKQKYCKFKVGDLVHATENSGYIGGSEFFSKNMIGKVTGFEFPSSYLKKSQTCN